MTEVVAIAILGTVAVVAEAVLAHLRERRDLDRLDDIERRPAELEAHVDAPKKDV